MSRLAGIDGLRAAAALWVVLFHARVFSGARLPLAPIDFFVRSGSTGVSLFLVISGFCLYLPFAAGRQGRFKAGSFFMRRARRLLPAYYCSIAIALGLHLAGGGNLGFGPMSLNDVAWQIVTHVTLTHTLFTNTFYALNGAYWSLGLEWQLYLALPLLILGIRRFGLVPTLGAAIMVNVVYRLALALSASHAWVSPGLLPAVVLPNLLPGRWAEFVFGMIIAELYARGSLRRLPHIASYAWAPMMLLAIVVAGTPLGHLGSGAAFAFLVTGVLAEQGLTRRIFSWRPLVTLGIMSYSLYLVHQPVIQALAFVLRHDLGLSPTYAFAGLIVLAPVVLAIAWALFVLVERYTLTSHPVEITGRVASILFPRFGRREALPPVAVRPPLV